jgi:hypothetical protein
MPTPTTPTTESALDKKGPPVDNLILRPTVEQIVATVTLPIRAYSCSMGNRRDRDTFAALLRDLPSLDGSVSEDVVLLDPDGHPLPAPRRLTARDARPWVKREDVPLGLLPCGAAIEWTPGADRDAFAVRLRRIEGKDCNPAGDLLLFTLTHDRHALVLDDSP